MYSLDQELAFATQKVREQRAVIAALQSDLAAAKERESDLHRLLRAQSGLIEEQRQEIAMARKALIAAWAQNYYHEWVGSTAELPRIMERHKYRDAAKTRAEARYAREIAQEQG